MECLLSNVETDLTYGNITRLSNFSCYILVSMFSSTGLFQNVPCPRKDCCLPKCVFAHDLPLTNGESVSISNGTNKKAEDEAATVTERPLKRRRLSSAEEKSSAKYEDPQQPSLEPMLSATSASLSFPNPQVEAPMKYPKPANIPPEAVRDGLRPASIQRPVSPPPVRQSKKINISSASSPSTSSAQPKSVSVSGIATRQKPAEALNPRSVLKPPATHPVRLAVLNQLHAALVSLNEKSLKDDKQSKSISLSNDELTTMALDEEEQVAKTGSSVYSNIIKQRIVKLRKMGIEDWQELVQAKVRRDLVPEPEKPTTEIRAAQKKPLPTDLSVREQLQILRKLRTPLTGLENHGYVTTPPAADEIESARNGVKAAGGYEKCDRCGTRFQVFPGRREEDGALTTHGSCTYHWARLQRPQSSKTDAITGQKEAFFPCCKESIGQSSGCTTLPHHVFKVSEVKRLAGIMQFEHTPGMNMSGQPKKVKGAVTFDCEMGYTTMGMELIRLTAISWPQGKELLDVLVRPIGEILDPNTRFSGVSLDQLATARPYGEEFSTDDENVDSPNNTSEDGEIEADKPTPLKIASSPAAARQLLFDLLSPETPLLGHAIDNDLNTTRIIHPFIIDTVLLFPHPRGLPIRYGLKMLTAKYLERDIQTAGADGHDSKEDALATGDLVSVKVADKWRQMQTQGWKFKDGELVEPEPDKIRTLGLRPFAGEKRSVSQVDGSD